MYYRRAWRAERKLKGEAQSFYHIIQELLCIVGPSLTTFSCLVFNPYHNGLMFQAVFNRSYFPVLTSLTLRVSCIPGNLWEHYLHDNVLMPVLTNFHLSVAKSVFQRSFMMIILLCRHCPSLDYLMLSGTISFPSNIHTFSHPTYGALLNEFRRIVIQRFSPKDDARLVGFCARNLDFVTTASGIVWLPTIRGPTFDEWKDYGYMAGTRAIFGDTPLIMMQ
jgi:hypothetical protein